LAHAIRARLEAFAPTRADRRIRRTAKEGAQGAALIADGLAAARIARWSTGWAIREARGSVLDHLYVVPRERGTRRLGCHDTRAPRRACRPRLRGVRRRLRGTRWSPSTDFGDLDLQASATEVHVVRVDGRFSARAAAAAARDVSCEAVVYEASFETIRTRARRGR